MSAGDRFGQAWPWRRGSRPEPGRVAPGCVTDEALHAHADERGSQAAAASSPIDDHLDTCDDCRRRHLQIMRYRTVLLRARVPGLRAEQWRALDERMALLGSEPPPRRVSMGARFYWGLTLAAGTAVLLFGVVRWLEARSELATQQAEALATVTARAALASQPLRLAHVSGALGEATGGLAGPRQGDLLRPGQQLRADAAVAMLLADAGGGQVARAWLTPGTEARIDAASGADVFVRLQRGSVEFDVAHRRSDQRFVVLAGAQRVQVVGTRFLVEHDGQGGVAVRVREGAVRIDAADVATAPLAETQSVVRAGQHWQVRGGVVRFGPEMTEEVPAARPPAPSADQGMEGQPAPAGEAQDSPTAATEALPGEAVARARPRGATAAIGAVARPAASRPGPPAPAPQLDQEPVVERRIVIEVPPQRMSEEEVARARAAELGAQRRRAGSGQADAAAGAASPSGGASRPAAGPR